MKQSNIKIAVTGGIGSGKSTVCEKLFRRGFPTFSCDKIYAELLEGGELLEKIQSAFGKDILLADGSLDRGKLASYVFSDAEKLNKLNSITHPAIFAEMFRRAEGLKGLIFFEVPLLFEGGYEKLFDKVIVVEREENERVSSVSTRDGLPEKEVRKRIEKQHKYKTGELAQYYVIHNCGNLVDLDNKIEQLLSKIANDCNL